MNSFTCWGTIVKDPVFRDTDPTKPIRVEFYVDTPSRLPSKPMRFLCTTIAKTAEKAIGLKAGEQVLVSGRLEPNFSREGKFTGLTVLMSALERFSSPDKS